MLDTAAIAAKSSCSPPMRSRMSRSAWIRSWALPMARRRGMARWYEVCERLRSEGVDVVRVSYPDLIGVDRGRDVLLEVLPAAMEHGLAFCRAVYHTSPMGD